MRSALIVTSLLASFALPAGGFAQTSSSGGAGGSSTGGLSAPAGAQSGNPAAVPSANPAGSQSGNPAATPSDSPAGTQAGNPAAPPLGTASGARTAPPPLPSSATPSTNLTNRAGAASSGGSPGARAETEKGRQAQERMRKATQGICQGC